MKTKLFSQILVALCLALACFNVSAQAYARVTIYTQSQQNVSGTLKLFNIEYESYDWTGQFYFNANEGQTVDGGYMYQKWVLLENFGFPYPVGELYYMEIYCGSKHGYSNTYDEDDWPQYLDSLESLDFRSQGGG